MAETVETLPAPRLVGWAWDAILLLLFGEGVYTVVTDGYGLGLEGGLEGVFFTVGGLVVWGLLLALFFRPVGRAAILQPVAAIRFLGKTFRSLFGVLAKR